MIHVLDLAGCAPTPLAHYLKALGILRLIGEQADPKARGWWENERFRLATSLSADELRRFFLDRYEPTPIFNPWGGRSGYYPGSSEKSARQALLAIEQAKGERFDQFRAAIASVRDVIGKVTGGGKPDSTDQSQQLVMLLRRQVRGRSSAWMDTVTALVGTGNDVSVEQPALIGTGGNEGSGSYTSAYMAAVVKCLIERVCDGAITVALFGGPHTGADSDQFFGQFVPSGTTTPWDLLLAFEGAVTVRSAVSSRNATTSNKWMSSPFFVAPSSFGYASGSRLDEFVLNKGKELPGRGEQWFPLWTSPMVASEVAHLFLEGRAATKHGHASDGWSMLRAVTSLGVRRGIDGFVRYGYQQRRGLAIFAVPLGRFRVPDRCSPALACLDDLESWLPRLHRFSAARAAPARLVQVERRLADALFAVAQHPDEAQRWQTVLIALSAVEAVQKQGTGFAAGPVPPLRPDWFAAADDRSHELRLALALALQKAGYSGEYASWWNTTRRHWLPLERSRPDRFARSGTGRQARLQVGPEVVMAGRRGSHDAIALVGRRLAEGSHSDTGRVPLIAAWRAAASGEALAALTAGEVDLDRTLALARALMAIDTRAWARQPALLETPKGSRYPDDGWMVVRLALLPWPLVGAQGGEIDIGTDPAVFRRLAAGDAATAVGLARRRLAAAGVRTAVRAATVPPYTAQLWAAALAFPISPRTAGDFLRRLDPTAIEKEATA